MHLSLQSQYANQRQQFKTPISAFNLTKEKLATMASKFMRLKALIYRTVGYFEERISQLSAEEQKDGKAIAAAIAEYAIECSIEKYSVLKY